MTKPSHALLSGLLLGAIAGACGPVRTDGPTAVVLKVLLNEGRGTRILFISGVDDTPVNVFRSQFRPEQVSPAQLPTGETVRVLLDDSLGGTAVTFGVVGFDGDGVAVEQGSVRVDIVARQELMATVRLSLYEDPDAGVPDAGGAPADAGSLTCACASTCCDTKGQCAPTFESRGTPPMRYAPAGAPGHVCIGYCNPVTTDRWNTSLGACGCGNGAACGKGLRCDPTQGRCICDTASNCSGCCSQNTCITTSQSTNQCGAAGRTCAQCNGNTSACLFGVCGTCTDNSPGKCCTGGEVVEASFPNCRGLNGACEACERSRADRCASTAVGGSRCACGELLRQCTTNQLCVSLDGGTPRCVDVPILP